MRKKRISAAYRYCFAGLVLQLWLYCEETLEAPSEISEEERASGTEFRAILKGFLKGEDEAFEQLKSLRDRMIGRMEILTAFSDCFQIYEYVLNRVERRFVVMKDSEYTPEKLASALTDSLLSSEDSAERNGFLRDIVAQLPVRFTRQKFYAMMAERLSSYIGLNRKNVEDYLYMLKTSVMIGLPEGMERERDLWELLDVLCRANYKGMDQAEFDRCMEALDRGSRLLSRKTDGCLSLQQMINDLYVLFLTEGEKLTDARENEMFRAGAGKILDALDSTDRRILEDDEIPEQMEGIQEAVMDLVMAGSSGEDPVLDKVDRLVSGSSFMSVEPETCPEQEADRQWLDRETETFCRQLDDLFGNSQKMVVRAVMARVISSLPMVFGNSREVEAYIRSSLESCTDFAEREASMELLEQELIEHVLV